MMQNEPSHQSMCHDKPVDTIEQEIQAKGLTAPRVTPADIESAIASEHYFTALQGARMAGLDYAADFGRPDSLMPDALEPALGLLTFCVLVLRNGFTVTGESACASPDNFDADIGRKIARQNAIEKIWPLLGYELRSRLAGVAGEFTATDMSTARAEGYQDGVKASEEDTHL